MKKEQTFQTKKMYRAKELAEYLGIGLSTVWHYSKQKKIYAIRLSSRVTVFDIDEVRKALFSNNGEADK